MDLFDAIQNRCSVREFSDKPIGNDLLLKIVDAGRFAATARNVQPWHFIVISDKDSLAYLGQIAPNGKFLGECAVCVAVVCSDTKYFLEDGCAATQNILLGATALGIGSCWVAGEKKEYAPQVLKYLNAPAGSKLISLIALGYPKNGFSHKEKIPLDQLLHQEKF